MNFRSVSDMNATLVANLWRLPHPIDLVVGVPRSGLLAATLLSLAINAPVADLEGYCAGRMLARGKTRRRTERASEGPRNVVILDDSIFHGTAMREAREKIAAAGITGDNLTFAAVYGNALTHPDADLVMEAVPQPRAFQWNVMHHGILADSCMDIDGVLCLDPTREENDDGPAYTRFLTEARPLSIPTRPVKTLVTSRLERYRPETEAWLKRWGVEYGELVMLDLPDAETRRRMGAHASHKAKAYAKSSALLFIESEHGQSLEIARQSGKPVLCMCCHTLVDPPALSARTGVQKVATLPRRFMLAKTPLTSRRSAKLLVRRLLGDMLYTKVKRLAPSSRH